MIQGRIVFFILMAVALIYATGWHYFASLINRDIQGFINQHTNDTLTFSGNVSPVYGFPGIFQIRGSGKITIPHMEIDIPEFTIKSIPLPGHILSIDANQGINIMSKQYPENLEQIKFASLELEIPHDLPPLLNTQYLKQWQEKGTAQLQISSFNLLWDKARAAGSADISLNNALQIEADILLQLKNTNFFLSLAGETARITPDQINIARAFLYGLPQQNNMVTLPLNIRKNNIYLNMMRIGSTSPIIWSGDKGIARKTTLEFTWPDRPQ